MEEIERFEDRFVVPPGEPGAPGQVDFTFHLERPGMAFRGKVSHRTALVLSDLNHTAELPKLCGVAVWANPGPPGEVGFCDEITGTVSNANGFPVAVTVAFEGAYHKRLNPLCECSHYSAQHHGPRGTCKECGACQGFQEMASELVSEEIIPARDGGGDEIEALELATAGKSGPLAAQVRELIERARKAQADAADGTKEAGEPE